MSTLREELGDVPSAEAVQKAFDDSRSYDFGGYRTQPWTIARHSVALQLRSRLVQAMDDENLSLTTFLKSGFYPHIFHDVVVVMFLLHQSPVTVVKLEELSYSAAMVEAYAWAETVGLLYGSKPFFEATKILGKILHQIRISWFQLKQADGANGDAEKKIQPATTEELGKSNSLTEPSEQAAIAPSS